MPCQNCKASTGQARPLPTQAPFHDEHEEAGSPGTRPALERMKKWSLSSQVATFSSLTYSLSKACPHWHSKPDLFKLHAVHCLLTPGLAWAKHFQPLAAKFTYTSGHVEVGLNCFCLRFNTCWHNILLEIEFTVWMWLIHTNMQSIWLGLCAVWTGSPSASLLPSPHKI